MVLFGCPNELRHFGICSDGLFLCANNPNLSHVLHCYLQKMMLSSRLYALVQLCYTMVFCSIKHRLWFLVISPMHVTKEIKRVKPFQLTTIMIVFALLPFQLITGIFSSVHI